MDREYELNIEQGSDSSRPVHPHMHTRSLSYTLLHTKKYVTLNPKKNVNTKETRENNYIDQSLTRSIKRNGGGETFFSPTRIYIRIVYSVIESTTRPKPQ